MSRHEWEKASITLPAAEYTKFRKEIQQTHNRYLTELHTHCVSIYYSLKAVGKGKRNFNFSAALYDVAAHTLNRIYGSDVARTLHSDVREALFPYTSTPTKNNRKPNLPKKKDIPFCKAKCRSISGPDFVIEFKDDCRTVLWSVPEGNHACSVAHLHPVGKAFFKRLESVKWTRTSGGTLVGNDEYNRASRHEGGGGNYTKDRWGADEVRFEKDLQRALKRTR